MTNANQPGAAWADVNDPLYVVCGHLISPQDGFGEIGRMADGALRRYNRMEIGAGGIVTIGNMQMVDAIILGALQHEGTTAGFYNTAPIAQQVGVAVTAAGIHAAIVALGLFTA